MTDQLLDLTLFAPLAGRADLVTLEASLNRAGVYGGPMKVRHAAQAYARQALANVAGMRGTDIVRLWAMATAF
jgi:hypothetical protein